MEVHLAFAKDVHFSVGFVKKRIKWFCAERFTSMHIIGTITRCFFGLEALVVYHTYINILNHNK